MKFNTLKIKVLGWFTGIVSLSLFVFSFLLYYFIEEDFQLKMQNKLYYSAKDMHDEILEGEMDQITFNFEKANGIEAAIIKNNKIIKKTEHFDLKNYQNYLDQDEVFFKKEVGNEILDIIYVLNFEEPYHGSIVLNQKALEDEVEKIEDILLILNLVFLFLLLLIGNKLINKILLPINNIIALAKDINVNNLTQKIDISPNEDELKKLVNTFNEMIERLKKGIEKIDRFNNDISHELRTPLTVISTQVELALKKERTQQYYIDSLKKIDDESNKMKEIVHNMLMLTKYTQENIQESFSVCDLNSLLINVIEEFHYFAREKNIFIKIQQFEKSVLKANCSLLRILFSNLLDNAIKYSPTNRDIVLSLYTNNGSIIFVIQDQGIGIPKESLPKVTDRFFRVDESRNKSVKGYGLGLSLVKNIVELHHIQMKIDSKEAIGTTITLTF